MANLDKELVGIMRSSLILLCSAAKCFEHTQYLGCNNHTILYLPQDLASTLDNWMEYVLQHTNSTNGWIGKGNATPNLAFLAFAPPFTCTNKQGHTLMNLVTSMGTGSGTFVRV